MPAAFPWCLLVLPRFEAGRLLGERADHLQAVSVRHHHWWAHFGTALQRAGARLTPAGGVNLVGGPAAELSVVVLLISTLGNQGTPSSRVQVERK